MDSKMKKLIFIFILATTNVFCQNVISNSWYKNDLPLQIDTIQEKSEPVSAYRMSLNLQEATVLRSVLNSIEYSKLNVLEKKCLTSLNTYIEAFVSKPDTKMNLSIFVPVEILSRFASQFSQFSKADLQRKEQEIIEYEDKLFSKQNIHKQIKEFETKKNISKSIISQ